MTLFKMRSIG